MGMSQSLSGMDRTERITNLGESPMERTELGKMKFSVTPFYSYFSGEGAIISGPGARLGFAPFSSGIGRIFGSYHYDTITGGGGHQIRDLFVVNVQLTPDNFPVTINGTYTNDNLRNSSRFTGWGATVSKSFNFGPGQTLELGFTGTQERISFPGFNEGGGGGGGSFADGESPIVEKGTVWDGSAALFFDGGVSLLFDYVFDSDFEGRSLWFTQVSVPFGKSLRARFILGQDNVTGFEVGWKF